MERILEGLQPEKVFYYFEEISKIPRGSGNEKEISDYLYNLARSKGWDVIQDEFLNIIIRKSASKGYENSPTVMLQGHMDMVCEKNEGVEHDFLKDPINLRVIDGCIYGTDTTLGADNGIAVAMALSILDSDDLEHPALEVLITTDEEKGMTGAENLDGSIFKSKYLLNLDSEEEGVFTSGCAGGSNITFTIPIIFQNTESKNTYKLSVKGLQGGHSGVDIHKERGNANKILGRILYSLIDDIDLVSINGGSKTNAIPREASSIFATGDINILKSKINWWNDVLKNEYSFSDPNVNITLDYLEEKLKPVDKETFRKLVTALNLIHTGVLSKSTAIDLVISSNNLAVINTDENTFKIYNHCRSSVKSLITEDFAPSMEMLAETLGIKCEIGGYYPGWEYAKNSVIRDLCIETYKDIYGKEPVVAAIHAGLECGLLIEKIKGLDAISMGPNAWDAHSPNEHVSIKSVENIYNLLIKILSKIRN